MEPDFLTEQEMQIVWDLYTKIVPPERLLSEVDAAIKTTQQEVIRLRQETGGKYQLDAEKSKVFLRLQEAELHVLEGIRAKVSAWITET